MLYFNCFCIMVAVVLIIDLFKFWDNFSSGLIRIITKGKINAPIALKPFNCSTCLSWWVNLIYLIISGVVTIPNITYILLLSGCTNLIYSIFLKLEDKITNLIEKI